MVSSSPTPGVESKGHALVASSTWKAEQVAIYGSADPRRSSLAATKPLRHSFKFYTGKINTPLQPGKNNTPV